MIKSRELIKANKMKGKRIIEERSKESECSEKSDSPEQRPTSHPAEENGGLEGERADIREGIRDRAEKITGITPEELEEILKNEGITDAYETVKKIKVINPELAKIIANEYRMPILDLSGLETIDKETIDELIIRRGIEKVLPWKKKTVRTLRLNGLEKIGVEEAKILAQFEGDTIMLNGIKSLSVETAKALAEFKGKSLFLNGLTEINVEIAKEMGRYKVNALMLQGIEEIGVKEFRFLAEFGGEMLDLSGLGERVDETTIRAIEEKHEKFNREGRLLDVPERMRHKKEKEI